MHKLFDFFDDQVSELLPLLYLFGTAVGTAYFFVGASFLDLGHTLAQDPFLVLVFITGIVIAVAVELHAYLQQRRARQAWQELQRTPTSSPNYPLVKRASLVAHRWMIALMAFQMVSSMGFWLIATDLTGANLFLWGAVLLRGAIVPLLLYGTGYLSRLRQDAAGILGKSADRMLLKTVAVQGKQWARRLNKAAHSGANLAPIAIDLMMDAGETEAAQRIQRIEAGLTASEQGRPIIASSLAGYQRDPASGLYVPQSLKSTGAKRASLDHTPEAGSEAPQPPAPDEPGKRSPLPFRKPRKAVKKSPEERVFSVLGSTPEASLRSIAKQARVSHQTAVEMRARWLSERGSDTHTAAV